MISIFIRILEIDSRQAYSRGGIAPGMPVGGVGVGVGVGGGGGRLLWFYITSRPEIWATYSNRNPHAVINARLPCSACPVSLTVPKCKCLHSQPSSPLLSTHSQPTCPLLPIQSAHLSSSVYTASHSVLFCLYSQPICPLLSRQPAHLSSFVYTASLSVLFCLYSQPTVSVLFCPY